MTCAPSRALALLLQPGAGLRVMSLQHKGQGMSTQRRHSQFVYQQQLDALVKPGTRWLDLGCGDSIIPEWVRGSIAFQKALIARCDLACGCDPVDDRPHKAGLQKYVGPCEVLPYPDGLFDLITVNMVAEHIEHPERFMAELGRVLAEGGRILVHTPNRAYGPVLLASLLPTAVVRAVARRTDGRKDEEIFRTFYRMNTRRALESLEGFRAVEIRCVETSPVLHNVPVANLIERLLIRVTRWRRLEDLRADWIAVLEKRPMGAVAREMLGDEVLERRGAA